MAQISPFQAIRYDFERFGRDLSRVIAPPYDVLDQADKDALLAGDAHNIVAVDLPHTPPKSLGPPQAYADAATLLDQWRKQGVLIREDKPALYVYHQEFEHASKRFTRKMFIARLRLVPFSEGVVLPHEETFGGPKEDRLALTRATRCNMSPVFGLFTDPEAAVDACFASCTSRDPDARAVMDDVENRLWVLTEPEAIAAATAVLAPKQVFIADGHHRYGTALNYQTEVAAEQGGLSADHPANYVMCVLGSMDDPGCLILPYNRALVGPDANVKRVLSAWSQGCEPADPTDADLVLFSGVDGSGHGVRFSNRKLLTELEPNRSEAWRSLDVAYLHRYLIDELARSLNVEVRYVKSEAAARATAKSESGIGLLMRATKVEQLRSVSEQGELMPQKSTYFHPKLATGLTINPLN